MADHIDPDLAPLTPEEEPRYRLLGMLIDASEAAHALGDDDLEDALDRLVLLWDLGFADRAAVALNRETSPVLAHLEKVAPCS